MEGEEGGPSGIFLGAVPQKARRGPWAKRASHNPQSLGRWVYPRVAPRHVGMVPPRGIWGCQQGTVTPNCWPAALATPPLPRLLLTAAHSSGTAALFTPDRSAHGVTAGCCKPGPARNAAVAAGAVTPSAEPGLAAGPRSPQTARQVTRSHRVPEQGLRTAQLCSGMNRTVSEPGLQQGDFGISSRAQRAGGTWCPQCGCDGAARQVGRG